MHSDRSRRSIVLVHWSCQTRRNYWSIVYLLKPLRHMQHNVKFSTKLENQQIHTNLICCYPFSCQNFLLNWFFKIHIQQTKHESYREQKFSMPHKEIMGDIDWEYLLISSPTTLQTQWPIYLIFKIITLIIEGKTQVKDYQLQISWANPSWTFLSQM